MSKKKIGPKAERRSDAVDPTPATGLGGIVEACRLLGDETRLRLLRALGRTELNVTELTAILCITQSGVSRHLKLLREAGLVGERREGSWAYYALRVGDNGHATPFWQAVRAQLDAAGDHTGDNARLEEVLRARRERASSPFAAVDDAAARLPVPGRSWIAWARALLHLVPPGRILDVGSGEGGLAFELSQCAREVVAIDRSPAMLQHARRRAAQVGATNIRFEEGELEHLPVAERSIDTVVLSQILHHAAQPQVAIAEAHRVLAPGGRLLILDLAPHGEDWVRERLGDLWLGFAPEKLHSMLAAAGLTEIRTESVPRQNTSEPFEVVIATGVRPDDAAKRPTRTRGDTIR